MTQSKRHFYSGGLKGAEAAFGEQAEMYGISETTYAYEGQPLARGMNVTILSEETLKKGDVSMEIVSARMGRRYAQADRIRKVFQVIFHMVNKGCQVLAIGWIQEDGTVKGGTGWAVELGKFFNRPVSVFDQEKGHWYSWKENRWALDTPVITEKTFCGTGTRNLTDEGRAAIAELFKRSFS